MIRKVFHNNVLRNKDNMKRGATGLGRYDVDNNSKNFQFHITLATKKHEIF